MALDSIVGDAVGFVLIDRVVFAVRNVVGHVGVFVIGDGVGFLLVRRRRWVYDWRRS